MKRNRLILASLIAGVALSATSVSFSYAWYASATRLRVEEIVLEADPERSLLIANAEDGEYKSALTLAAGDLNRTGLFTPITSAYSSNWLVPEEGEEVPAFPTFYDMSYSMTRYDGVPYLYEASKRGYFCQEVWLKSDDDLYITIKTDDYPGDQETPSTSIKANVGMNELYAEQLVASDVYKETGDGPFDHKAYSKQEYLTRLNSIEQCGRLAIMVDDQFVVYNPNKTSEGEVYFGGAFDNNRDHYFDYYQSQTDGQLYEVFYGELKEGCTRDQLVYKEPLAQDSVLEGEWSAFNALHRAGVHALDLEASKPYIQTEPSYSSEDFSWNKGIYPSFQFEIDAYTPKRVVVAFYLEGWDLDSNNAPMGAYFDLELYFRIVRER